MRLQAVGLVVLLALYQFTAVSSQYTVQEERSGITLDNLKELVQAQNPDASDDLTFNFISTDEIAEGHFDIDPNTGDLSVSNGIDRESLRSCVQNSQCSQALQLTVNQQGSYFTKLDLTLTITDINDKTPVFPRTTFTLTVPEDASINSTFIIDSATDLDSPANGVQSYELTAPSGEFTLDVSPVDGELIPRLRVTSKLDFETQPKYDVIVKALDTDGQYGELGVVIQLLDINDNRPLFESDLEQISVPEDKPVGELLLQVKAEDPDSGENGRLVYSLKGQEADTGMFLINATTGRVYLGKRLDYETQQSHVLRISAEEVNYYSPVEMRVEINVEDVNDEAPAISVFLTGNGGEVVENSSPGQVLALVQVEDKDTGLGGEFSCVLNDANGAFELEKTTVNDNSPQQEFSLKTVEILDREETDVYHLVVYCQDRGSVSLISMKNVTVTVRDVNDSPPEFTLAEDSYIVRINENNAVGAELLTVTATDADAGENGRVIYSLTSEAEFYAEINPTNGVMYATSSYDYERTTSIRFSVQARNPDDVNPFPVNKQVVIEVNNLYDEPPKFSKDVYSFKLNESNAVNQYVGIVEATVEEGSSSTNLTYSFAGSNGNTDKFSLNSLTGEILASKVFDADGGMPKSYELQILATDYSAQVLSSSATVFVNVQDINDSPPVILFPAQNNTVFVTSDLRAGARVTEVTATDADQAENSRLVYTFISGNEQQYFTCHSDTGVVTANVDLSTIAGKVFFLDVFVQDTSAKPLNASALLVVNVTRSLGNTDAVASEKDKENTNLIIVIIVAVISSTLIIILIIAITVLIRSQKRFTKKKAKQLSHLQISELHVGHSAAATAPVLRAQGDAEMEAAAYQSDRGADRLRKDSERQSDSVGSSISDSGHGSNDDPDLTSSHPAAALSHPAAALSAALRRQASAEAEVPPPRPPRGASLHPIITAGQQYPHGPFTPDPHPSTPFSFPELRRTHSSENVHDNNNRYPSHHSPSRQFDPGRDMLYDPRLGRDQFYRPAPGINSSSYI